MTHSPGGLLLRGDRRFDAAARRWVSRFAVEAGMTFVEVAEVIVAHQRSTITAPSV
jgi:hypothetical protein